MKISQFDSNINESNFKTEITKIRELKEIFLAKYDYIQTGLKKEKIAEYVQQRCDNYAENKTKMIDSIINRRKQTITIDKVIEIVDKESEDINLITDPNTNKRINN